jgi:hypothetical protein
MIVARTLASAARSCIQRCRQSRGGATRCSCDSYSSPREVTQPRPVARWLARSESSPIDSACVPIWILARWKALG